MLVAGVLLERRALGRGLEILEADLTLDALGREVLSWHISFDRRSEWQKAKRNVDVGRTRTYAPEGN